MQGILSIQSHVTYGHAGNSSAVFPIQRMGIEVWPIHTVQFSNHTHYTQGWSGEVFSHQHIESLVDGLKNIGALNGCKAVISGYQFTSDQCLATARIVKKVKAINPHTLYICDPVMNDVEKGCVVEDVVNQRLKESLVPLADAVVPNLFELEHISGTDVKSLDDAITACRKIISMGVKMVVAKNITPIDNAKFSMILATADEIYLAQRPLLDFPLEPVGVGDLITAIFTAGLVQGHSPVQAFQHCHDATYGILLETQKRNEWEIQTIAAQSELITPTHHNPIQQLDISAFGDHAHMNQQGSNASASA